MVAARADGRVVWINGDFLPSSLPTCSLGFDSLLRPLPAPPRSRSVCVTAGWGADPEGRPEIARGSPSQSGGGDRRRVKGAGGLGARGGKGLSARLTGRGAGTDAASAGRSLQQEAAGDRGRGRSCPGSRRTGPHACPRAVSVRELTKVPGTACGARRAARAAVGD
uniref:Uncharacterized protein n=1 Tax=Rangifer tarandus platyrhynchus TaxID=3082113 RepID=A0ACB0DU08_RANTA|nr:unnamed protein product [Rangifer tarandus platyrhynchus]